MKRIFKKILTTVLVLPIVFLLVGCSGSSASKNTVTIDGDQVSILFPKAYVSELVDTAGSFRDGIGALFGKEAEFDKTLTDDEYYKYFEEISADLAFGHNNEIQVETSKDGVVWHLSKSIYEKITSVTKEQGSDLGEYADNCREITIPMTQEEIDELQNPQEGFKEMTDAIFKTGALVAEGYQIILGTDKISCDIYAVNEDGNKKTKVFSHSIKW